MWRIKPKEELISTYAGEGINIFNKYYEWTNRIFPYVDKPVSEELIEELMHDSGGRYDGRPSVLGIYSEEKGEIIRAPGENGAIVIDSRDIYEEAEMEL